MTRRGSRARSIVLETDPATISTRVAMRTGADANMPIAEQVCSCSGVRWCAELHLLTCALGSRSRKRCRWPATRLSSRSGQCRFSATRGDLTTHSGGDGRRQ
jgi:hypothetical protein